MKCKLRLAWVVALGAGVPGARAGVLPTPYPEGRYREMCARSPFAVSTAASAVAAATPGFAAQLFVDGVAHVGASDFVAIKSRDLEKGAAVLVEVGQSTEDGVKIERVRWSNETGKSTVDVSKGSERATLIFDEAQLAKNGADAAAPVIARGPNFPGMPRVQVLSRPGGPEGEPVLPQTLERGMTPQGPVPVSVPMRVSQR
jgi:hypothetical protein